MTAHHSTRETVIRELDSDRSRGLSSEQIAEKRSRYGENKLREKKKKSNILLLLFFHYIHQWSQRNK